MAALPDIKPDLTFALEAAGLAEAFDQRGLARTSCPSCRGQDSLKLSLAHESVRCGVCGMSGSLRTYLAQRAECAEAYDEVEEDAGEQSAQIIILEPAVPDMTTLNKPAPRLRQMDEPMQVLEARPISRQGRIGGEATDTGKLGERIIMTMLAMVFLVAGFAATGLSGFANFQAFSMGVSDPLQSRIWGWSGVIASACSFGGFTFFWWHLTAKRVGEALRALVFALAGAGTSLAGTSLYMEANSAGKAAEITQVETLRSLHQAELEDWTRQLEGIPATTRSVEGLEAYLAGVEAAGRTHQKPYRDAQNELGLAKRRASLEADIAGARERLYALAAAPAVVGEQSALPSWFFALMLEVFASQGTSIACVSLLLLYGARKRKGVPEGVG